MMKKYDTLKRITDVGVVAVIRADDFDKAYKISEACVEGGIPAIEVTFTTPGCEHVIKKLKETIPADKLIIGAGTVLDSETARVAILNGAEYIVSPGFDLETCKLCNRYQIPYMPGCMTITEMLRAMEAGADVIKVFPGSAFGPSFIKAVKAPLPQAVVMPTGGVNLDNVAEWIKNGCVAVGVGGALNKPAETGDFAEITRLSKLYVEAVKAARK